MWTDGKSTTSRKESTISTPPSLSVLTATPVSLEINGVKREFRPLTISVIGKWLEKLAEQRCKALPTMVELMSSMKGHESSAIRGAIHAFYELHKEASDPPLNDLMDWLTSNPANITSVIADCAVGDDPIDKDALFVAVVSELNGGGDFANRWLIASGLAKGNPTKLPPT